MECPICRGRFTPRAKTQRLCGARECRLEDQRVAMRERDRLYREQFGVSYFDRYAVERVCGCGAAVRSKHAARNPESTCATCQRRRVWQEKGGPASAAVSRDRSEARRAARGQLVPSTPLRRSETLVFREAARRLAVAGIGTRAKRAIWVGASCHRCAAPFVALWTNSLPRFCSKACSRLAAKVRRRQRGGQRVPYRRLDIFERDRWTCQLCGKRVKRTARVPDPKAPVIDHIVPLAAGSDLGGVDTPWNVQTAHFLCNSIKNASYDQPALALEVA